MITKKYIIVLKVLFLKILLIYQNAIIILSNLTKVDTQYLCYDAYFIIRMIYDGNVSVIFMSKIYMNKKKHR